MPPETVLSSKATLQDVFGDIRNNTTIEHQSLMATEEAASFEEQS